MADKILEKTAESNKQNKIKICMIGLGSIGKKHIDNLVEIMHAQKKTFIIDALRSGNRKLPEGIAGLLTTEYYEYHSLPSDYDMIFVTNPTSKHYEAIQAISTKTRAMFIEKPLFESNAYTLDSISLRKGGIYYVACPLRHKAIIQYVKNLVENGEKIYAVRAISSSFLPEWRPGVDYRQVYSARKELGGGVTLDLIHEWDYLTYLFGMPQIVHHIQGHYSELEMDSDDISVYIAGYQDKTVEVHLDYVGRKAVRKVELYCKNYTINVDILSNRITYESDNPECQKEITFPEEDSYKNEMKYFYDMVFEQKENMNTIAHASEILKLVLC